MLAEEIKKSFVTTFKKTPLLVRSPGRVNLIGEHTDYNNGFVLPAAIDKQIIVAISTNYGNTCRVLSHDLNESHEFDINDLKKSGKGWPDYIMGVVEEFKKMQLEVKGFDCVFGGDIPLGAGLSSSAALECAFAFALNVLHDHKLSKMALAQLGQRAENEFVGVKCGIMDQFASVHGKAAHVIRLDCRDLTFEYFPFDMAHYRLVLCDTQVKHSLASSEYNTRRQECEAGVRVIQQKNPDVHSLRDATLAMLDDVKKDLAPVVYQRCRYVIEENARVTEACERLQAGDLTAFGRLMYHSHEGLSRQYEVSCKELDFLVEQTHNLDYVPGARMMGGGFGGCTINLVQIDKLQDFTRHMTEAYSRDLGKELKTYTVKIENGTSKM
jgi:galactokinase